MEVTEFTSYLPKVRCSDELKGRLLKVAKRSVARKLADHIRFAVEQYVDQMLPKVEKVAETERESA